MVETGDIVNQLDSVPSGIDVKAASRSPGVGSGVGDLLNDNGERDHIG